MISGNGGTSLCWSRQDSGSFTAHKIKPIFFSDALSVLQVHLNHKLPNLAKALHAANFYQWIPAHCGLSGKVCVCGEGGGDTTGEQNNNNASFSEKNTSIRALTVPRSREQQAFLVRLRIGHSRPNSRMYSKLMLPPSPTCLCSQKGLSTEHALH